MSIEDLKEELVENKELLNQCIEEKDTKGVKTQMYVIRLLERQIEENELPSRYELEVRGERYGYDFH